MVKNYAFVLLLVCLANLTYWVHPSMAQISGPTTVTAGSPVQFEVSSPYAEMSYTWMFDGDFNFQYPVADAITERVGTHTISRYPFMVYEDGNFGVFATTPTANGTSNYIERYSFGSSLSNNPVKLPNIQIPGLNANDAIHNVVVWDRDNNSWHGFYSQNGFMVRADFGSTPLTGTPIFSAPFAFNNQIKDIVKYGNSWYALGRVLPSGTFLIRYKFDSDLTSALNLIPNATTTEVLSPYWDFGTPIHYKGEWNYFVCAGNAVRRINFGSTLEANSGTLTTAATITSPVAMNNGVAMIPVPGCDSLIGYVISTGGPNNRFYKLNFQGNIASTPIVTGTPTANPHFDALFRPVMYIHDDTLCAITGRWTGGNHMTRIKIAPLPAGSQTKYTDNTVTHTFSTPGTYKIICYVNMGNPHYNPITYCHTVTVVAPSGPNQPDSYTKAERQVCVGDADVAYEIDPVNDATGYDWSYTPANDVLISGSGVNVTLSFGPGASSGVLSVRATNATGSSISRDTAITVHPKPNVSIASVLPATTVCSGDTVRITATGGVSYSWTPGGSSNAAVSVVPATETTYTVTGTDANQCSDTATVTIEVNNKPDIMVSPAGPQSICSGDSLTLQVSSVTTNVHFEWQESGLPVGSNANISIGSAGSYTATVIHNLTQCSTTSAAVVVSLDTLPDVQLQPHTHADLCAGDTLALTAHPGPGYDYQWTLDGVSQGTQHAQDAHRGGLYKVHITDSQSGCSDSAAVFVNELAEPAISVTPGDTAVCFGNSVMMEVHTSDTGIAYQWQLDGNDIPFATLDFYQAETGGIYRVHAAHKSVSGCSTLSDSIELIIHPLPEIEISWDGTALRATPGYNSYTWIIEGQPIPGENDSVFFPKQEHKVYYVAVIDSNGCTDTSRGVNVREITDDKSRISDVNRSGVPVSLYPNPFTEAIRIVSAQPVCAELYNSTGQLIKSVCNQDQIRTADLPDGIYLIHIYDLHGSRIKSERLLKNGGRW